MSIISIYIPTWLNINIGSIQAHRAKTTRAILPTVTCTILPVLPAELPVLRHPTRAILPALSCKTTRAKLPVQNYPCKTTRTKLPVQNYPYKTTRTKIPVQNNSWQRDGHVYRIIGTTWRHHLLSLHCFMLCQYLQRTRRLSFAFIRVYLVGPYLSGPKVSDFGLANNSL